MSRRAVFLDRDGVLNRAIVRDGKPFPPASPEELEILPDVPRALKRLKELGYLLIVVTNQPDVARGKMHASDVEARLYPIGDQGRWRMAKKSSACW